MPDRHPEDDNQNGYGLPSLLDVNPEISAKELLEGLKPASEFTLASYENYVPSPAFPSQGTAVHWMQEFSAAISGKRGRGTRNVYMDGGFGVGKTHLLASCWNLFAGEKLFGTFLEYTSLVGYLGYQAAREELARFELICIDEFELDDPGDTMLMSRLLKELDQLGVRIAATSNTPPSALGEGRFAAEDFRREIFALADRFEILTIDGEDYRHRAVIGELPNLAAEELEIWARTKGAHFESLGVLLRHLASLHQVKYRKLVAGVSAIAISKLFQINDQLAGLRFVVLVDRLYEQQVPLRGGGDVPLSSLFSQDLLESGYRKKYLRCQSRLLALANL